jgi:outer membrane immunogenic protein
MNRVIAALLAGSALIAAAPALAADLPEPVPVAPAMEPLPTAFDWTGVYVGANFGYLWGTYDTDIDGSSFDNDNITGGLFVGYNYMATPNVLIGAEADINLGPSDDFSIAGDSYDTSVWYGTLRARVGYAFDSFLVYGTGGFAFANADIDGPGDDDSNTHFGWTIGAGVEAALTQNVTARLEYQYIDTSDESYSGGGLAGDFNTDFDAQIVRVGLAYKF